QVLAPEVVAIQFRYSDGVQIYDTWDSESQQALPVAIEVRMWLQRPVELQSDITRGSANDISNASQFVMTIPLWRATLAGSASSSGSSSDTSSSNSTSGSSSGGTGSSGSGNSTGGFPNTP